MDSVELTGCPFCKREPQTQMQFFRDGSVQAQGYLAARCEHHTQWIPVEQWNRRALSGAQEGVADEPHGLRDIAEANVVDFVGVRNLTRIADRLESLLRDYHKHIAKYLPLRLAVDGGRADVVEECARVCDSIAALYRENGERCYQAKNYVGANSDASGEMGCHECADKIRALSHPAPDNEVRVPVELLRFLHGLGPLDGVEFGEPHPTERGKFWWRKWLPPMEK